MGSGASYSHKEIAATRSKAAEEKFNMIIDKVEQVGGEIIKDEESPLYMEIGMQEEEVGKEREVEFNLNRTDYRIIRSSEEYRVTGAGRTKSFEKMESPRVQIKLYKKPETSNDWLSVDLEELF